MNAEQNTKNAPRIAWTNDFAQPPSRPETLADGLSHLESRAEDFRAFMAFDRDRLEELRGLRDTLKQARAEYSEATEDSEIEAAQFALEDASEAFNADDAAELAKLEDIAEDYGDHFDGDDLPEYYGLSLDYQFSACGGAPGLVFLLSTGGGHEEVIFRMAPGDSEPESVEFVWKDWGTGIGFDVTGEDWADWLWERFSESAPYLVREAWEQSGAGEE